MFLVLVSRAAEILGASDIATLKSSAERYGCLHHSSGVYRIDVDGFVARLDADERSEAQTIGDSKCANDANS